MDDHQTDAIPEQPQPQPQPKATTITYEDVNGRPRKGRVGRAGKSPNGVEPEEKKTVKRAVKLSGKDVGEMFEKASSVAVMFGAHTDWYIPSQETAGFQDELADLLNRIPARYAQSVVDLSGYAVVAVGLYGVFKPRIEAEQLRHAAKEPEPQQPELLFTA